MKKFLPLICLALWSIMLHGGGVTFIITADLHGQLDSFAKLAPVIRRYPEAVKIDLGDMVQGNFAAVSADGFPVLQCFNALGYQIIVPGNHDLEFPEAVLIRWQKFFRGQLLGAQWALGNFRMPGFSVVEKDGFRIGIIALGAVKLKKYAAFWKRLSYHDETAAVSDAIDRLRMLKCDAYLLIGHIGAENVGVLNGLLRENPEINAVIGSHTHREVPGGRISGIMAVQPAAHGNSAVKLELIFDNDRHLKYLRSSILYPQKDPDPEITAIIRQMEADSAGKHHKILGKFRDIDEFGRYAAEVIRQSSGADAAVIGINKAAFRKNITAGTLFEMLPYGNRITVVTLPRAAVRGLLRRKSGGRKYFGAGDFSKPYIKVAISDFLLSDITDPPEAEVLEKFERQEIEKALKSRNIPDFNAE